MHVIGLTFFGNFSVLKNTIKLKTIRIQKLAKYEKARMFAKQKIFNKNVELASQLKTQILNHHLHTFLYSNKMEGLTLT